MKKIIILSLAVISGHYINAMEQQSEEKQIKLLLKDNKRMTIPESELPFFTTISDVAHDHPNEEIPLKDVSLAAMTVLRKEIPWAWDIHKKIKENITGEEIAQMPDKNRKSIAQEAAMKTLAMCRIKSSQLGMKSYDIATLKGYIEAGPAAVYLGSYELIQKCAGSIMVLLHSDAYLNVLRKHKQTENVSSSTSTSSSSSGGLLKNLFGSQDPEARPTRKDVYPEDIKVLNTIDSKISSQLAYYVCPNWVHTVDASFNKGRDTSVMVSALGTTVVVCQSEGEGYTGVVSPLKFSDSEKGWLSGQGFKHKRNAQSVAMPADGKTIVTFNEYKAHIIQWCDISRKWRVDHSIDCDANQASICADGKTIIVSSNTETHIVKYSDKKKHWLTTYKMHHGKPLSALLSEDGNTAVMAFGNTTQILKWQDQAKEWIESLDENSAKMGPAAVSADGTTVMAEFKDGRKIVRWSAEQQQWLKSHTFPLLDPAIQNGNIAMAAMSANGNTVATLSKDNTLQITKWNSKSEEWDSYNVGMTCTTGMTVTVSAEGDTVIIIGTQSGKVTRFLWHDDDKEWKSKEYLMDGISLNGLTYVKMNDKRDTVRICESICFDTFATWEKKMLAIFLAWCSRTGKPVTEIAWVKQAFETCDKREKRLLNEQYGSLVRILTDSGVEKFE